MTVLENAQRLSRPNVKRRKASKNASVEVSEKAEAKGTSECFPIKVSAKPTETIADEHPKNPSEDTDVLNFQPEPHTPFDREPTYNVDTFQKNNRTVEKILTPPPNFKEALSKIPQPLQAAFKEILNGELVGVWPIGSDCLRE